MVVFQSTLQIIWASVLRRIPKIATEHERLELPDGDFVDLDWTRPTGGPLVVVLHGLQGSSRSPYVRGLLRAVGQRGWRGVALNFRSCSGTPNRLPRTYHSGDTADLDFLIRTLRKRTPKMPIAVVGYSLGGNVLLKWLGEQGNRADIQTAVAVCAPLLLDRTADRLNQGLSRVYQYVLVSSSRRTIRTKFKYGQAPISLKKLATLRQCRDFDHYVTAPLHGFMSAEHYYAVASARQYLI